jgi:hypothetical protein
LSGIIRDANKLGFARALHEKALDKVGHGSCILSGAKAPSIWRHLRHATHSQGGFPGRTLLQSAHEK